MTGSDPSAAKGTLPFALSIAVLIAAALPFLPLLQAEFVNWDDDKNFVRNEAWRGLSATHLAWMFTTFHYGGYHPLSWLSVAIDHAVWGMDPRGYHLTNLLLHATDSMLVFWLFTALLSQRRERTRAVVGLAAAIAIVFAVHPLRVESVAWITERRGLLAAAFLLATLLCWLRACRTAEPRGVARRRSWYALALLCYGLSLLSKSLVPTLPFVLLLLDVHPLRRFGGPRPSSRAFELLLEKVPFLAATLAIGYVARLAQEQGGGVTTWSKHGLSSRLAQSVYSLCFYVVRTFVPADLCVLHPLQEAPAWAEPHFWGALLAVAAVTAAAFALRRRWPGLLAGWLAYGLLLLPVSGLMQAGPSLVAERYSYVPSIALFAGAAAGAAACWPSLGSRGRKLAAAGWLLVVVVAAALSWRQCAVWRDSVALWTRTLAVHPDCLQAHLNLGAALAAQPRSEEAAEHYRTCTRLRPGYGSAWYSLGLHLLRLGQPEEALAALSKAHDLVDTGTWTDRPATAELLYSLALANHAAGHADAAQRRCRESVAADPHYPHAYVLLADILVARGERQQALLLLEQALAIAPAEPILRQKHGALRQ
ncbi:MAG TPA: tetratricopeptide repeat protein [Planctomycetota bacterium]|nr:tetratricopeptide repeat protein [Planctomycetota bacterium]